MKNSEIMDRITIKSKDHKTIVCLVTLWKLLFSLYPPRHYKHARVWTAFWHLIDEMNED